MPPRPAFPSLVEQADAAGVALFAAAVPLPEDGSAPEWVTVFPKVGRVETRDGRAFEVSAATLMAAFADDAIKIPVDVLLPGPRPGDPAEGARPRHLARPCPPARSGPRGRPNPGAPNEAHRHRPRFARGRGRGRLPRRHRYVEGRPRRTRRPASHAALHRLHPARHRREGQPRPHGRHADRGRAQGAQDRPGPPGRFGIPKRDEAFDIYMGWADEGLVH